MALYLCLRKSLPHKGLALQKQEKDERRFPRPLHRKIPLILLFSACRLLRRGCFQLALLNVRIMASTIQDGEGCQRDKYLALCASAVDGVYRQSSNQHERADSTQAIPTSKTPTPCAQVRAKRATDEACHHIDRIQTIARVRIEAIDTRLIRNMGGLSAQIQQNDANNQAPEPMSGQPHAEKREQHDQQRKTSDIPDRKTISQSADKGG